MKRREFLLGSGFLSRRGKTKAVENGVKTHSFLHGVHAREVCVHINTGALR